MKVEQIQRAISIGVIGGLGAIGSADLYAKMTKVAAKAGPQERIKVQFGQQAFDDIDMAGAENAQTNARKLYVFDMLREFEERKSSAVLLPCFISHTFLDEVQAEIGIPVIDMVAAIRRHLAQRLPKLQKIGVLTSSYVRKKGLFEKYFGEDDVQLLYPAAAIQHACLMRAVYGTTGIKNGYLDGESIDLLYRACRDLLDQGAQVIVPGMTEISTVAAGPTPPTTPILNERPICSALKLNADSA